MSEKAKKIAVIGGGMSGLVAAITAKRRGINVTIYEKNDKIGKKILATGNGKCNIANNQNVLGMYNSTFPYRILDKYDYKKILAFFEDLGVLFKNVDDRIYPYSEHSSTILNALRSEIERLNIEVRIQEEVKILNDTFVINNMDRYDLVILATGSPATFGLDSTYLYKGYGHKVRQMNPALVPLLTDKTNLKGLKGIRSKAEVSLFVDDKKIISSKEEVIFKDNGVSGTAVFAVSSYLARLENMENAYLLLDLIPDYSHEELINEVINKNGITGFFHKEIVNNIYQIAGVKNNSVLSEKDIKTIVNVAKGYKLANVKLGPVELAQVVSGGLDTTEFDADTLESKICPGLYATGEALNVDGVCGGFNLMWAIASGLNVGQVI